MGAASSVASVGTVDLIDDEWIEYVGGVQRATQKIRIAKECSDIMFACVEKSGVIHLDDKFSVLQNCFKRLHEASELLYESTAFLVLVFSQAEDQNKVANSKQKFMDQNVATTEAFDMIGPHIMDLIFLVKSMCKFYNMPDEYWDELEFTEQKMKLKLEAII